MSLDTFILDPQLTADTRPVAPLPLCDVLLMNDARYPWLILVPRHTGLVEISDLSIAERTQLWDEADRAATALRSVAPYEKLNLGALGNIVRQLHVHVVGRSQGDAAWPGPVWGHGTALPYAAEELAFRIEAIRLALGQAGA